MSEILAQSYGVVSITQVYYSTRIFGRDSVDKICIAGKREATPTIPMLFQLLNKVWLLGVWYMPYPQFAEKKLYPYVKATSGRCYSTDLPQYLWR